MLQPRDLLAFTVLLAAQPGSWTAAGRPPPQKGCASCRDFQDPAPAEASTSSLALGEPCGVYTLNCAPGLRCMPPRRDHSPLQALLQGRGECSKNVKASTTEKPFTAGPYPSHSGELEKAPCRKLLNSVLRHLELIRFTANRDVYIPNCDLRGFYRKKQCHSSKGMQRGRCWCVDEHGTPLHSNEDGTLPCDGN